MMAHSLEKGHLHVHGTSLSSEEISALEAMGPERAAISFCQSFTLRMKNLMDSSDEVVKSAANFYHMARSQRVFRNSTKVGDPLVCERIFVQWAPAWRRKGSSNYYNMVLNDLDVKFFRMTQASLLQLRLNRYVLEKKGSDNNLCSEHHKTLDGCMEETDSDKCLNEDTCADVIRSASERCRERFQTAEETTSVEDTDSSGDDSDASVDEDADVSDSSSVASRSSQKSDGTISVDCDSVETDSHEDEISPNGAVTNNTDSVVESPNDAETEDQSIPSEVNVSVNGQNDIEPCRQRGTKRSSVWLSSGLRPGHCLLSRIGN